MKTYKLVNWAEWKKGNEIYLTRADIIRLYKQFEDKQVIGIKHPIELEK